MQELSDIVLTNIANGDVAHEDGALKSLRVIAYKPELAAAFGNNIEAAIFYQQLLHWSQYAKRKDGMIYKTAAEMFEETRISEKKQRSCRDLLIKLGFIEAEKIRANGSMTWHYRVLIKTATVFSPVGSQGSTSSTGVAPVPTSQNASSITKNTQRISLVKKYESEMNRLYKGWLIEMIIGRQKFMATAEGSQARADLLESASRKTRLTDKRKQKLAARIDNLGVELCSKAIVNIGRSDFHKGQNDRKWKATLEWLFNTDEKVEEFANR